MGKVYVAKNLQKKSERIDASGNLVDRNGNIIERRDTEESPKPQIKKTSVQLGPGGSLPQ